MQLVENGAVYTFTETFIVPPLIVIVIIYTEMKLLL